ncbi:putative cullin-like protein 2 isoform X2 [Phragmites australis]|uniref:putative cullin-like protein 2 isoform X2 n=1 Tax=Phragmites australis TaxID=29695 RepID=UPI002D78D84E|nr:putative cullin-like protein 2 isoform X2 [Phragmites australis]
MNGHLNFEDGWRVLEQGIVKCSKILEGFTSTRPTVAEYMDCYDCAYRMAVQKNHYCQEMYNGYKMTLEKCVHAMVLPHLMHKRDDYLFREIVNMWSNYRIMVSCVFSFFKDEVTDALLTLIRRERDGSKVDMGLLMDVMCGICRSEVQTFMNNAVLQDTYAYYSMKSSEWIMHYTLPDYLAKVQECMDKETMRLTQLSITEGGISELCLQVVSAPLMQTYDNYAREKHIGGQLLLQTYKTVEEELLGRCLSLTLGGCSDDSSFN